jgi:hypothetical protein
MRELGTETGERGLSANAQRLKSRVLVELATALDSLASEFNSYRKPSAAIVEIERAPSAVILRDSAGVGMVLAAYADTELRIMNACRIGPSEMARLIPEWSSDGIEYSYHDSYDIDSTDTVAQNLFAILIKSEAFTEEHV